MNYQEESARTEARNVPAQTARIAGNEQLLTLLHAGMGLASEGGEFLSAIKAHLFYGRPLDETNLIEELGDIEWFCAQARRVLNISQHEVQSVNLAKLHKRFPEKFTEAAANNRDLAAERKVLET